MLPRPFALLWLAGAFALGGCFLFEDPPVAVPDPAPLFVSDGTACGDACANRLNCVEEEADVDEAMRACLASCNRVADDELNGCLKDASCDDVEDCFPPDPTRHCAAACAILASCSADDDLTLENCSCFRYSPEAMACIGATDCAGVQACIEAAPRESACIAAATKLGECNELDQAVGASWVRSCAVDWKEGLTDCIAASPCDVLVARCLPSPLPANCYGSCRRLAHCEALGEISAEACAADCEANAWTEERRRCIKTTLCDELPGACPEVAP